MKYLIVTAILYLYQLYPQCSVISSIPITIVKPGRYCFVKDLINTNQFSVPIIINSDNVVVDLRKYSLINSTNEESHSSGIESYSHSNILIKNRSIKNFMVGIRIQDNDIKRKQNNNLNSIKDISIINMSFEKNSFRGVLLEARNIKIENSQFYSTGGTNIFPDSFSIPIEISGKFCKIINNFIKDFYPNGAGEGVGISLSSEADGCEIKYNIISNSHFIDIGRTFGVWVCGSIKEVVDVSDNYISGVSYAGVIDNKIVYSDNVFNKIRCSDFYGKERKYYKAIKNICPEENTKLLITQANLGDVRYLYKVGYQYLVGLWVDQDYKKAYFYFGLAAKKGHVESLRLMKRMKDLGWITT